MAGEVPGEDSSSPSDSLTVSSMEMRGARGEKLELYLSDGSSFFISRKVILEQGLGLGDKLTAETIEALKTRSAGLEVRRKAMELLARSAHSVRSLEAKLLNRDYAPEVIRQVLAQLTEQGYLNDQLFAEQWLHGRILRHPEGRSALVAGLRRRGVAREIALEVTESIFTAKLERESALRLIDKLNKRAALSAKELSAKLSARHFSSRIIRELVPEAYSEV